MMDIKSVQTLVSQALEEVKTISTDEAYQLSINNKCNLIDIREKGELDRTGRGRKFKPYPPWYVGILAGSKQSIF